MNRFYVACDLGAENGRVMLGTLHKDKLTISEIRRFANVPHREKDSWLWNIPRLYQDVLGALREVSLYDEPVAGVSCSSWPGDYLLFKTDGSLVAPTYHPHDPRTTAGAKAIQSRVGWEAIYEETGVHPTATSTLFHLGAEKTRRLKHSRLLPIADGFNYLLSGVPRIEMSLASTTQLFNPVTRAWSERLLKAFNVPPELLPDVVAAGTKLGPLRPEILKAIPLEDAQVIASCSHELAAALVGLPVGPGENWVFLRTGTFGAMGAELIGPLINDASREFSFTNEIGYRGVVHFHKPVVGLWILDECKRFWKERDQELGEDVLTHLAIAAEPFESLIDPTDPRFLEPGDMPMKIQSFCKETNQSVPRKPGPILRCVLESIALSYRKTLEELEGLTGRKYTRLSVLGGSPNNLLYHFIANALQLPIVLAPPDSTAIGNVLVQALALGHIESLDRARDIVQQCFKAETITPHAAVWNAAYDRLAELAPS
jgi:rhamnulokinase